MNPMKKLASHARLIIQLAFTALTNGYVNGYGNGNFGPNDLITREQLARLFYLFAQAERRTCFLDGERPHA